MKPVVSFPAARGNRRLAKQSPQGALPLQWLECLMAGRRASRRNKLSLPPRGKQERERAEDGRNCRRFGNRVHYPQYSVVGIEIQVGFPSVVRRNVDSAHEAVGIRLEPEISIYHRDFVKKVELGGRGNFKFRFRARPSAAPKSPDTKSMAPSENSTLPPAKESESV